MHEAALGLGAPLAASALALGTSKSGYVDILTRQLDGCDRSTMWGACRKLVMLSGWWDLVASLLYMLVLPKGPYGLDEMQLSKRSLCH